MVVMKLPSGLEVDISTPVHYKERLVLTYALFACGFVWMSFWIYLAFKSAIYILNYLK
jgi:hypothetical protein